MKSILLRGVFLMYTTFVLYSFSLVSHFALLALKLGSLSSLVAANDGGIVAIIPTPSCFVTEPFDSVGLTLHIGFLAGKDLVSFPLVLFSCNSSSFFRCMVKVFCTRFRKL